MMTMVVSIILGCGVPPVAAYSLVAIVTVPALIKMGVVPLSAHFFCFYFSIISAVTPPVALGALAGAGIAEANYFQTATKAFKLSIAGFIIPYLIVYNPVLTLHVENWAWALGSLISIPIGLMTLSAVIYNVGLIKFTVGERILALACSASMFGYCTLRQFEHIPLEYPFLAIGLGTFAYLIFSQVKKVKTKARAVNTAH